MLSRAAAAGGDPARAATLAGVARRIWRDVGRTGFGSGYYRERITDDDRLVRAALGGRDYEAAYRRGWALTPDAAVAYALGAEPGAEPGPARAVPEPGVPSPLSRREREVAELIVDGLTNREIAARLYISRRTADSHIENILRKLGFTSRAQVAAWVIQQRSAGNGGVDATSR